MACSVYGSDVTPEGGYTASSEYGSGIEILDAFDDDLDTYWLTLSGQYAPSWFYVDYFGGNEKQIEKLRFYHTNGSWEQYMPKDFQLQGSNTGAFAGEEDVLLNVTGMSYPSVQWYEWEFENSNSYRYYRVYISAVVSSTTYAMMPECEMMECTLPASTSTSSSTTSTSSTASTTSTTSSTASTTSTMSTTSSTDTTYTGYTYPSTSTSSTTTSSTVSSSSTSSTASTTSTTASTSSTTHTTTSSSTTTTTTGSSSSSSTSSSTTSSSTTTTTTAPQTSYCVFRDVTIPDQSLITKANIYLTAHQTNIPTPLLTNIYLAAEDNPTPPTGKVDLDTRPETSIVPWVIADPWFDNVTYKSPDLSTIVQEIVDRSGFSSGNNIMAMIKNATPRAVISDDLLEYIGTAPSCSPPTQNWWLWRDANFLYSGCFASGLSRYSIDGSGNLTLLDTVDPTSGIYYQLWGDNTFIYAAQDIGGLNTYKVDGSGDLVFVDQDTLCGRIIGCWGDGDYIYVGGDFGDGISTYSVNGSGILSRVANRVGICTFIWGDGNFIYVTGSDGLKSYSVDSFGDLTLIDTDYQGIGHYGTVFGDGNFIYVGCWSDGGGNGAGLRVYSVDGSGNLTHVEGHNIGLRDYRGMFRDANYLYVGARLSGLEVFTVSGSGHLTSVNLIQTPVDDQRFWGLAGDSNFIYTANPLSGISSWRYPTTADVDARFWSALEHLGGAEKACLRVHWRPAEKIQTPRIEPVVEFQLDNFFCSISTYPTDAAIYYTTNGSDPDEGDTLYTGPFEVSGWWVVKAKAYKQYWIPSDIAQRDYSILFKSCTTPPPTVEWASRIEYPVAPREYLTQNYHFYGIAPNGTHHIVYQDAFHGTEYKHIFGSFGNWSSPVTIPNEDVGPSWYLHGRAMGVFDSDSNLHISYGLSKGFSPPRDFWQEYHLWDESSETWTTSEIPWVGQIGVTAWFSTDMAWDPVLERPIVLTWDRVQPYNYGYYRRDGVDTWNFYQSLGIYPTSQLRQQFYVTADGIYHQFIQENLGGTENDGFIYWNNRDGWSEKDALVPTWVPSMVFDLHSHWWEPDGTGKFRTGYYYRESEYIGGGNNLEYAGVHPLEVINEVITDHPDIEIACRSDVNINLIDMAVASEPNGSGAAYIVYYRFFDEAPGDIVKIDVVRGDGEVYTKKYFNPVNPSGVQLAFDSLRAAIHPSTNKLSFVWSEYDGVSEQRMGFAEEI